MLTFVSAGYIYTNNLRSVMISSKYIVLLLGASITTFLINQLTYIVCYFRTGGVSEEAFRSCQRRGSTFMPLKFNDCYDFG